MNYFSNVGITFMTAAFVVWCAGAPEVRLTPGFLAAAGLVYFCLAGIESAAKRYVELKCVVLRDEHRHDA